jgi:RNA polymerase sigma factor (sigma-70 family)
MIKVQSDPFCTFFIFKLYEPEIFFCYFVTLSQIDVIMSKDNFHFVPSNMAEINLKISQGDESAWDWIYSHCKKVFRNWGKEEKVEIRWIAENDKTFSSEEEFHKKIFEIMRNEYHSSKPIFDNYKTYQEFVRKIFCAYVHKGFESFFNGLKRKAKLIWLVFEKVMYDILIPNLRKKKIGDDAEIICSNTFHTFSDKLEKNNHHFENSVALKSYVLDIAHFKTQEYYRDMTRKNKRFVSIDDEKFHWLPEPDDNFDRKDNKEFVTYLLDHLDKTEFEILKLFYYEGLELKEIAQELNKTHENVRQIKFRALNKLRNFLNPLRNFYAN